MTLHLRCRCHETPPPDPSNAQSDRVRPNAPFRPKGILAPNKRADELRAPPLACAGLRGSSVDRGPLRCALRLAGPRPTPRFTMLVPAPPRAAKHARHLSASAEDAPEYLTGGRCDGNGRRLRGFGASQPMGELAFEAVRTAPAEVMKGTSLRDTSPGGLAWGEAAKRCRTRGSTRAAKEDLHPPPLPLPPTPAAALGWQLGAPCNVLCRLHRCLTKSEHGGPKWPSSRKLVQLSQCAVRNCHRRATAGGVWSTEVGSPKVCATGIVPCESEAAIHGPERRLGCLVECRGGTTLGGPTRTATHKI